MEVNEELLSFIRESLTHGHSVDDIRSDLLGAGWDQEIVSQALEKVHSPGLSVPRPPQSSPAHSVSMTDTASAVVESPESSAANIQPASKVVIDPEEQHKKVVRLIVTAGALMLGVGIYYFLAVHWLDLSKPLRLLIIIVSMLAAYGSGWYLQEKSGLEKIGSALIMLGTLMYGGGIFLIAQMYSIHGYAAEGWALWAFGSAAIAVATKTFHYHYLTFLLAVISGIIFLLKPFAVLEHSPSLLISALSLIALFVIMSYSAMGLRRELGASAEEIF